VLFPAALFPDGPHDPEVLYRIGPLTASTAH
jgi:L-2,4-diaminobutyric acid acetyltransferase